MLVGILFFPCDGIHDYVSCRSPIRRLATQFCADVVDFVLPDLWIHITVPAYVWMLLSKSHRPPVIRSGVHFSWSGILCPVLGSHESLHPAITGCMCVSGHPHECSPVPDGMGLLWVVPGHMDGSHLFQRRIWVQRRRQWTWHTIRYTSESSPDRVVDEQRITVAYDWKRRDEGTQTFSPNSDEHAIRVLIQVKQEDPTSRRLTELLDRCLFHVNSESTSSLGLLPASTIRILWA